MSTPKPYTPEDVERGNLDAGRPRLRATVIALSEARAEVERLKKHAAATLAERDEARAALAVAEADGGARTKTMRLAFECLNSALGRMGTTRENLKPNPEAVLRALAEDAFRALEPVLASEHPGSALLKELESLRKTHDLQSVVIRADAERERALLAANKLAQEALEQFGRETNSACFRDPSCCAQYPVERRWWCRVCSANVAIAALRKVTK